MSQEYSCYEVLKIITKYNLSPRKQTFYSLILYTYPINALSHKILFQALSSVLEREENDTLSINPDPLGPC